MKNTDDYRKGFLEGLSVNNKYPQTIRIMDYSLEQIMKLIAEYEEKQMKTLNMTRQEAISKCHGMAFPETFIQALEALGLIEFEPKLTLPQKIGAKLNLDSQIVADVMN